MSERSSAAAQHFRIGAPANWFTVDLDPATYRRTIRTLIEERLGTGPEYEDARRELFDLIQRFTSDAIEQGAVQAFLLSDKIGERPMAASLMCTVTQTPGPPILDDVAAGLRRSMERQARASDVTRVELPAGSAVRVRARRTADLPGDPGPGIQVETLQYFLVIPGREALLLLSFSTPDIAIGDAFVELFDVIAQSLSWEY